MSVENITDKSILSICKAVDKKLDDNSNKYEALKLRAEKG